MREIEDKNTLILTLAWKVNKINKLHFANMSKNNGSDN